MMFTMNMSHKEFVLSRSYAKIHKDRCVWDMVSQAEHWKKLEEHFKGKGVIIQSKCLHLFNFYFKKLNDCHLKKDREERIGK